MGQLKLLLLLSWISGSYTVGNIDNRADFTEHDAAIIASCDFNNNAQPFCNFRQDTADESDWIRHKGPTPTTGTGPSGDYPDGTGYYIYHEADNVANMQKARLLSPVISNTSAQICVQFQYTMYGSDDRNTLTILAKRPGSEEKLWQKSGMQSPSWLGAAITVPKPAGESIEIVFEAMRGFTSFCDTALDNINITEGPCPECIAGCDFDQMDDYCGWTNKVSNPSIMGWEFWNGPTDTPGTGPDNDFSKPDLGLYLLMDSFSSVPGASAQLWSPSTAASSSNCLQLNFHYYLYGTASNMELTVHVVTSGGALGNPVFSVKGNQGQGWKPAEVQHIGTGDVQFVIVGTYGETEQTDIAIDSVCITTCEAVTTTATPKPSTHSPTTPQSTTTTEPSTATTPTTPVKCPDNAEYIECGPACIPSCKDPSTNCTGSCISGCFCKPGFVFRGRRCVPIEQCGCLDDNNNYYEPGEIVLGNGCSKLCRCAGNYTLNCVDNTCDPTEECREVGGIHGCYPKDSSTCIASGDPHYTTFDKRSYDFMGTCTYLISEPCNSTAVPYFAVYAENENRYNIPTVSFVSAVHVHVLGVKVSVLKGGIVQLNGTNVNIPLSPALGVDVFKSGTLYTVAMSFGVTVRYDGNHYMDIKVIKDYQNKLCGLCGDYNGNAMDDFRTPSGELVSGPTEFGNSWNTDPDCNKSPVDPNPGCTETEEELYESPAYCGIILDSKGPFAACHPKVNPNKFFKNCVFDLCALGGPHSALCEAIEAYVNECQDRGVKIDAWRNSTFCPLNCPPNSHYDSCVSPCQPSCSSPLPSQCNGPCSEGCMCDPGYILSGDKCVKQDTCGCKYSGQYYKPGEEFYTTDCDLLCKCDPPFVTCSAAECPLLQQCGVQGGQIGCYPVDSKDCIISGDPHYNTFDGTYYSFMGTCTYTLARTCWNNNGPWFTVEGKNEERGVSGVSYLRKLYVTVGDITVTMMKSRNTLVNGRKVGLPHSPSPLISLTLAGQYVVLSTTFGLEVRWDGNHYAKITVPSTYYEQMCGLCGDYNGNPNNDFTKPDGSLADNSNQFGNSWQTDEDEDDICKPDVTPDPPCEPNLEAEVSKPEKCGKIKDPSGPFRDCIKVVDPLPFFQSCVYDMCRYQGLLQTLCDQLQAYTDACLGAGAPVHQWREPDFCPLVCPPNSHYSTCVSSCPETCVGVSGPPGCGEKCVEGCKCDLGFVLSSNKCVPVKECGCVDPEGSYHPVNESWYLEGCTQQCVCLGGRIIQCYNTSCLPTENCELLDGEYICKPNDVSTPQPTTPKPTPTTPPVKCPDNAEYIECGPACVPSCKDPSTNCTGSCISGCFCKPGFVFRGRRCVPIEQCGCLDDNNNYYEPGEIVLGSGCSKLCRCAGNYTLSCVDNTCGPTEECREVGGIHGCYPKDSSTCTATTDPHYTTFDKRSYNFMGNCTYLISEACNSTDVPYFAVYAENENRYNIPTISYVSAVHIHVLGVKVSVLKGGIVQLNGTNVNVPLSPAPGVDVFKSGTMYTVVMNFGVTVRYDGNQYMDIKVIKDYQNKLCGLCGDYNGNAMDDFRTPSGELVSGPTEFGNSWNTDPDCNKSPVDPNPGCTETEEELYESPAYCGIILDSEGPFAACHPKVNPNTFFKNCVFDLCALGGPHSALCEAIEAYVNECQDRGVNIGPWRNRTFCPLDCPPNSHYDSCVSPCQPSCTSPLPSQCNGPCSEGCKCDPGYLLSGDKCVKQDTCGCTHNGQYYQPGEEFYTKDCDLLCKCNSSLVTCSAAGCPPLQQCGVLGGQIGCYPVDFKDCIISGDPHYNTFDGKYYSFMGTCTYTLARTCRNNTGPWFSVEGKNEERGVSGVAYLRKLYVTVNGMTVTMMKSRTILVNGRKVGLPHSPSPLISLTLAGQYVILSTPFGLEVRWDGNHYAKITVPSTYYEQMCGLCGDYNGNPNNDFTTPNGSLADNPNHFGNSWQTDEDEDDKCNSDNKPDPPCEPSLEAEVSKPEKCGKIKDPSGPFRDCIKVVDPLPFFQSCVYDMCRYQGLLQTLCDQLQAYTDACLGAGAPVHQWREPDFCPLVCPPNSHYSTCVSSCPETCVGVSGPPGCGEKCVEGCKCDPGFVLSSNKCVPLKECGCVDPEGSYHPINESWYLESCTQQCVCLGGRIIQCYNTSCLPTENCELLDGEYICKPNDVSTPQPTTPKPTPTTPPVKCPDNAEYIECGPACVPSCKDPSTNCTGSCISGCFCKPGFVFRGRRCVPIEQCGCLDDNNNYYEPGEIVLGSGCSKLCRCAGNYTLSCVDNTCGPTEECREVGGIHGCYPKDSSTCTATTDPHYTTFDKRSYNFMGNCTYLISEACNSTDVPYFAVYAENENRYNIPTISYVSAVHVHVLGVKVSVLKGGIVQLNGTNVNVPLSPAPGVDVFKSGTMYTVVMNFGVTVRYDGNQYMDIKVIKDYQNKLCGLCGDYNGNAMDDFRTPSGELVSGPTEFGNSWNTDPDCNKSPVDPNPGCTETEEELYESPAYCGIILDREGPFAACHPKVNPNTFFKNCVFDLCALGGPHSALCEAIEAYVNECQDRGVNIGPWRNRTFCPLDCPPNSHYDSCVSPCQPSCTSPLPSQCNGPCSEGCKCDPGYLLSGDKCVKQDTCGCTHNGQYYQPGEEFYTKDCDLLCKCNSSLVTCSAAGCPPLQQCGVLGGQIGCYPVDFKDCIISGDPHYNTFDGKYYSFMGTCTYTLARTCRNNTGPWFSVEGKNEERGVSGVAYLRKLYVTVNGMTVTMMKSRTILVNGRKVGLPHSPSPLISLTLAGQYVILSTPFGLEVRWDGNHYAKITVPSTYYEQMCGLCGDYNGNPNNDFTTPNGSLADNPNHFGNSWQTDEDEDDKCNSDNKPDPPCEPSLEAEVSKPEKCGKIKDPSGPFRDCIKVVDPLPFFQSCVYDMCRYQGLLQTLCDQLQAYTDACLGAGAPVHQWREPDFCPLVCPPNSHYSTCVSSCPETCVGVSGPPGCGEKCVEGCKCDPGFVLSSNKCVPLKECGCVDPEGSYHPINESWYLESCTQQCVCLGGRIIQCYNTSCLPTENCELLDGEYICKPNDVSTPQPTTPKPTPTTPPVKCPDNAEYIECGPACVPSCKDPSTNCTGSCISGCFCKPGFVFRGRRCVPIEQCGCLDDNNNYYEPGEIVLGSGCSKLCRCAGNYTLSCVDNTCGPTEECREVGGIHGCYPKDSSTCTATTDPHYTTFDKRSYNFMGNCTYLISEACNSTDVPYFAVYAENENRYNIPTISYVSAVHVHVLGVKVSVLKGGIVQLNGTNVNVPLSPAPGVDVFKSGTMYTVVMKFGVTVRYDGNQYMDIKVIKDYQNKLCGLCGDYNGNAMDDFRTPSGELVSGPTEFGNSWNTDPDCNKSPVDPNPGCTETEEELYESPAYCGIILDREGPFAACHPKVNPNTFFKNCVFDLCALGGPHSALCEAIEAYVNECQDRGVNIGPWRNRTFCPLDCPPNSHYDSCVSPCQPSCTSPLPSQCNGPCSEGCKCDPGYLLSGDKCVKQDTCGCTHNGQYYQPGEEFYTKDCDLLCKCNSSLVTCSAAGCPPLQQCGVLGGQIGCYPVDFKDCIISGDPHYNTFDGKYYSFMGTCTYTLARTCRNNTGPWFSVEGKNEERGVSGVAYLRKLYVTVNGMTVTMMKSRTILVNGRKVGLPHSPSPLISLTLAGQYVILSTPFGLEVRWDGNHYAKITVPSTYYEQMCGLCGDYNGNPNNDFTTPNGSLADNPNHFGNSWQTDEDEDDKCNSDNKPDPPCEPSLEAEVSKPEKCGKIKDPSGPFRDCIKVVDPLPFFQSCVYDMCRYQGLLQTLCDQLQAYTDACLGAGAPVHQWREPDFCPLVCPPNSHYSTCVSSCPETCVGVSGPPGCGEKCVEGCKCDPGFVLSSNKCVPLKECGCVDPEGSYHPINESWYLEGCTQQCVCLGGRIIQCYNTSCLPTENCELLDGEYICKPNDVSTPQPTTPKPMPTTPPVKCPDNAEYIECGPACVPSCKDPSTNCTGSCISGCFCKPGFVFRGRRCVPIEQCGCLDDNNNYYEPGEIVLGSGCSKLCRCAGNYTLSCVDNTCGPTEECREVGGIHGCYPKDSSTCTATTDPHYTTFDKRSYNFMGNCTYLISEACNSTDVPYFAVYAENENRYNIPTISYVSAVHVHVLGVKVSVLKGGIVQLNGTNVNVPLSPAPGVDVFKSGTLYTVVMNFGVTVRYDGSKYMDIKVIKDYQNKLCGLCGDYNGNAMDDFRTPSGELVSGPTEFGNSWNTDPDCNKSPVDPNPGCTETEEELYESPAYCGIILDREGPFAACHPKVNPNTFFKNCVFDLCALGGPHSALCEAIEAYVNECQDRGVNIGPWRNRTFCPLDCPPNSHYDSCVSPCQPSCTSPLPSQCNGPCSEGCKCDPGYLLSGDKCVKQDTCGCTHNGQYYQPGEEFYTKDCDLLCKCNSSLVTCSAAGCPPLQQCGVLGGQIGCYPVDFKDCIISGDPHYNTFDGKYYSFMGTCTYTLARTCRNNTGPWFSVEGKNEKRGVSGVSYLRKLYVTVNGITVTMMKSRTTLINGRKVGLPHSPSPLISLTLAGQYVILSTPFGLEVRWDGNHYAKITVPSTYYEQMCGLCGDYNGNPNNDFTKPDGSLAGISNQFGDSWQTNEDEDDTCKPDVTPDPPCDPSLEVEVSKPEKCGKIKDPSGPFRDCIKVVDPLPFFQSCVYDMCRYQGLLQTLCDQLQAYTDACLGAGAPVHQWREPDFCPLVCPPNSHYSTCVSSCPETCVGVSGPPGCGEKCVEGCKCDPGYVLSNNKCVPLKDCGCVDPEGSYHPINESWYLEGCGQQCVCLGGRIIQCYNTSCLPTESCKLQDGEYICKPNEITGPGICSVSGDPHYTSFDKKVHHFMGACSYTLTKPCNETTGVPYFTVDTQNEHRGNNKKVSYVKSVTVNVYGMKIFLDKGRKIQANDVRVTVPVTLLNDIKIFLSGKFVVLETNFGLRVRFDGNHYADVSLPSSYKGQLCGMCGNYNDNPGDDNIMSDGKPTDNTNELGESWQVPDNRPDCTHGGGNIECDKNIETEAQKPTSCGMITDLNGIFKECHKVLPPDPYFENCVFDQCGTDGSAVALCQAFESYATLCAQAGVPINWRNHTYCPLKCPADSHYEHCGTACPPSCQDPGSAGTCTQPCVEGCVCNEGLILSGDKCVSFSQCGCTDKDSNYRPVGDSWFTKDDCSERCVCSPHNNVTCEAWRCSPAQECKVYEGQLSCVDTGVGICHIAGDPHYYTFDGIMHTYMGTCTYTLVDVCNSSMVTPFTIVAKNEERGLPEASYVRSVSIYLPTGEVITLSKSKRVLLNGQRIRTPMDITAAKAKVFTSGVNSVLATDFGLIVQFDGVHHIEITVPGDYFNKVCGMCGNYNNNPKDDNLMPNGKPAKDDIELGNSWKAEGDSDPGCQPDLRPDIHPNCTAEEEDAIRAQCSSVIESDLFKPCHSVIPPKPFLRNCIYDMCEYNGMQSTMCDNVEAYAQACRSAGVTISWRNTTFCPLPCPPNSHYSDCTAPCPPTCVDLSPIFCPLPPNGCVEGCQCDPGYVLSDGKCVSLSNCGCVDKDSGEYHDAGDTWLTEHCDRKCTCNLGGVVSCKDFHCSSSSICSLDKNGDRYCKPEHFDKCIISGDPHYRTFDKFNHHYQGPFTYVLTKDYNLLSTLTPLTVRGKNARRGGNSRISFLHEVYVDVYGVRVRMLQKKVLLVEGERVFPPLSPRKGIKITLNSRYLQLSTDFGLTVRFDGNIQGEVILPRTYKKYVAGLCGNYDGRANNEYMKPDGTFTRSLNEFGDSWRVSDRQKEDVRTSVMPKLARLHRREVEEDLDSGFETGSCSKEQELEFNGTKLCGALSDPEGPFADCHTTIDPLTFQEDCIFDLCAEQGSPTLRCESYAVYALACQEQEIVLGNWREQLDCAPKCGANSHYTPCMTSCPASCADLAAPSECEQTECIEGCECAPGFAMSDNECVPFTECGCTFLERYYTLNETFITEDCSQSCECTPTGAVCKAKACAETQICTIFNTRRNCYNVNPCLSYPCENGGTCDSLSETTYICKCPEGFEGKNCEIEKTEKLLDKTTIILIGVCVPLGIILIVTMIACICKKSSIGHRKNSYDTNSSSTMQLKKTDHPYENLEGPKRSMDSIVLQASKL